ncbi:MAG TPA: LemA family protein [Firmicutes bacterium]|jgi:LemA protein|nr:LemA family protein [Bacillota bacterium]HBR28447.1 LemA family protein [Bacillota bacterium]HBR34059.1 LemA family protein [Bacillota bacterium]
MKKNQTLWIVLGIILILVIGFVYFHNSFITSEEDIDGKWAEIENNLQRRADLIPNLVATVKGYAKHEEEVFSEIAAARSRLMGAQGAHDLSAASSELDSALGRLLVVVEAYPELKADQRFAELQDELAGTENRLSVARLRYNQAVQIYNTRIRRLPGSIVAGMRGLEKREYFQSAEEARELPKVEF